MGRQTTHQKAKRYFENSASTIVVFVPPAISALYAGSKGMSINDWVCDSYRESHPEEWWRYTAAFSCKSNSKSDAKYRHINAGLSHDFNKLDLYPGWVKNAYSIYFALKADHSLTIEEIRMFIEDLCVELGSAGIDDPEMSIGVFDPLDRYPHMYPFGLLKDFYFEAFNLKLFFNRHLFWGYSQEESIKDLCLPDKWATIPANSYTEDYYTQSKSPSASIRQLESYRAYFANPVVPESEEEKVRLWRNLYHPADFKKALESFGKKKTAA
jgi:hypothetical protein